MRGSMRGGKGGELKGVYLCVGGERNEGLGMGGTRREWAGKGRVRVKGTHKSTA